MGRILCSLILILPVILAGGCAQDTTADDGRLRVAVSIPPLADFARQVGGELVEVDLLVPATASPHTFQLAPRQMDLIARADVVVLVGAGLEFWADKAIDAAGGKDQVVVRTSQGIPLLDDAGHEHGHEHPQGNPHIWLSPNNAIRQVESIRDAFIQADDGNSQSYRDNAAEFIKRLEALDAEMRETIGALPQKRFIAFHPAWEYLARDYGLVQEIVVEESPGREPSAAHIAEVVETARRIGARVVFAEPQFPAKAAEVVAEELGIKMLYLDPFGQPPDYDYIQTMETNLARIAEGLGEP